MTSTESKVRQAKRHAVNAQHGICGDSRGKEATLLHMHIDTEWHTAAFNPAGGREHMSTNRHKHTLHQCEVATSHLTNTVTRFPLVKPALYFTPFLSFLLFSLLLTYVFAFRRARLSHDTSSRRAVAVLPDCPTTAVEWEAKHRRYPQQTRERKW